MPDYPLAMSDLEIARYQLMADAAMRAERELWTHAGAAPGARVADVGCGPGAVTQRLAQLVLPDGHVHAVDRDREALAVTRALAAEGDLPVEVSVAPADDTGLPEHRFDLVMMRHVLAHNGGAEQRIVDHLATLVRPGGCVYLADSDLTMMRIRGPVDPASFELHSRYTELLLRRGGDLGVGLHLDELLVTAGLKLLDFRGRIDIVELPSSMHGPAWAARETLLVEGLATEEELAGWEKAFRRNERRALPRTLFVPQFTAYARLP
ncbi:methyltransferase domain-containing protein [Actinocorallia sp. B10E7]|uniref:class I SAM-dependent methyltransferase n=1 Tax=Actinocorallia sp. B10E7 TaxID=3153558 RepID=UPI00325D98CE